MSNSSLFTPALLRTHSFVLFAVSLLTHITASIQLSLLTDHVYLLTHYHVTVAYYKRESFIWAHVLRGRYLLQKFCWGMVVTLSPKWNKSWNYWKRCHIFSRRPMYFRCTILRKCGLSGQILSICQMCTLWQKERNYYRFFDTICNINTFSFWQ